MNNAAPNMGGGGEVHEVEEGQERVDLMREMGLSTHRVISCWEFQIEFVR